MTTLPKRDWAEMTWQDFADADTARWIAVLPLAAVEQHGPHLPLGVDTFLGEAYLARAKALLSPELPVTFLPLQSICQSEEHIGFPGTLSLSAQTVIGAWNDIGESVNRAGVRKLLMITSHGGNVHTMNVVANHLRAQHGMLVVTCGWHRFGYPQGLFSDAEIKHGIHGGEIETSMMLASRPQAVRKDKLIDAKPATVALEKDFRWLNADKPAGFGWMTQDLHPSGAVGDASKATAEKGEAALDHAAKAFVELLREIDRFDLAALRSGPVD
jgi:creatinine amidohydrolase